MKNEQSCKLRQRRARTDDEVMAEVEVNERTPLLDTHEVLLEEGLAVRGENDVVCAEHLAGRPEYIRPQAPD